MEGFLDELRQLANEERQAVRQRDAAIQAAHDRHADAVRGAERGYTSISLERNRQMGALILRAVDEGESSANLAKALGISTRRAERQLRYYGEMSAAIRARYGAPPSQRQQRRGDLRVVGDAHS